MPHKISGRMVAEAIKERLAHRISTLQRTPGIAAILVGNNPASELYVSIKEKECRALGIHFEKLLFPETITETELCSAIAGLNKKTGTDAILVQLPLPRHLNPDVIIDAIVNEKDVDGFKKNNPYVEPVTLMAVKRLLESTGVPLAGKKAVAVCNSEVFCATMKRVATSHGMGVACMNAKQIADSAAAGGMGKEKITRELNKADVLIVAAGIPRLITADMVREGAIIIDIGTNKTPEGVTGDVSVSAYNKSSFYTPVPGGVGPVTVACLLENTVTLAALHEK